MAREIERKFLPADDSWRALTTAPGVTAARYRQGYLAVDAGRTVRVRLAESAGRAARAFLTIKGRTEGGAEGRGLVRLEFEYPIPPADAEALLTLCPWPLIEKTRHRVPANGLVWEVDEFFGANRGLVLIEVELERADQPIDKPAWVGEEVSGDARYANSRLCREPWPGWGRG